MTESSSPDLANVSTDALAAELQRRGFCVVEPEYITNSTTERAEGALHLAGPTGSVLKEVAAERARQDAKWGQMDYPSVAVVNDQVKRNFCISEAKAARGECDDRHRRGHGSFMDVLIEETAEANDAACERANDKLRGELVQVAAVAVAFIECLDRKDPARSSE